VALMEDWFPRGVFGKHPHRGIETVTYVVEGRIDHYDSQGQQASAALAVVWRAPRSRPDRPRGFEHEGGAVRPTEMLGRLVNERGIEPPCASRNAPCLQPAWADRM
jgi:Pirin